MNEKSPRRKWHRLHLSTWAVILLLLGFFVIVEIPGVIDYQMIAEGYSSSGGGGMIFGENFSHGWPWIYYYRPGGTALSNTIDIPWLVPRAWKFWQKDKSSGFSSSFAPLDLFLDLLVCLAIVLIAASLFEWRRRYRSRLFQFTLRELILLTLIVAGVFSWWRVHHNRRMRELELVKSCGDGMSWSEEYRGPEILAKIFGTGWLEDFNVQTGYRCDYDADKAKVEMCLPRLNEFVGLEEIAIEDCIGEDEKGFVTDGTLEELASLTKLQSLEISQSKISDAGMEIVSRFPNLSILKIANTRIDDAAAKSFLRMENLVVLDVSGTKLSDKSVSILECLSRLILLDISDTKISEDGYRKLRARLPNCTITYP